MSADGLCICQDCVEKRQWKAAMMLRLALQDCMDWIHNENCGDKCVEVCNAADRALDMANVAGIVPGGDFGKPPAEGREDGGGR